MMGLKLDWIVHTFMTCTTNINPTLCLLVSENFMRMDAVFPYWVAIILYSANEPNGSGRLNVRYALVEPCD